MDEPAPTPHPERRERLLSERAGRRNRIELIAATAVAGLMAIIGVFSLLSAASPLGVAFGSGFLLLAAGTAMVAWQLVRMEGAGDPAPAASVQESLVRRLEAERDTLRSSWLWYVGPTLPGFVVIYGAAIAGTGGGSLLVWLAVAATAAFLAYVVMLNRHVADSLDAELRQLRGGR